MEKLSVDGLCALCGEVTNARVRLEKGVRCSGCKVLVHRFHIREFATKRRLPFLHKAFQWRCRRCRGVGSAIVTPAPSLPPPDTDEECPSPPDSPPPSTTSVVEVHSSREEHHECPEEEQQHENSAAQEK